MNRKQFAQLAEETILITAEGRYQNEHGAEVDLSESVRRCVDDTRLIRPSDWPAIIRRGRSAADAGAIVRIEVTAETTLGAARRLAEVEGGDQLLVLNFASAKNPGGGFLGGSRAQEESLARSSALYASLQSVQEYYDQNRRSRSTLYTDHAIISPNTPVFRDDAGKLLDRPYEVTFFTMPAVNVGALKSDRDDDGENSLDRVESTMAGRIEKVLAFAAAEGFQELILGAWGCGVFRNDPRLIAQLFHDALFAPDGSASKFRRVVFAVYESSPLAENRGVFEQAFASVIGSL